MYLTLTLKLFGVLPQQGKTFYKLFQVISSLVKLEFPRLTFIAQITLKKVFIIAFVTTNTHQQLQ